MKKGVRLQDQCVTTEDEGRAEINSVQGGGEGWRSGGQRGRLNGHLFLSIVSMLGTFLRAGETNTWMRWFRQG